MSEMLPPCSLSPSVLQAQDHLPDPQGKHILFVSVVRAFHHHSGHHGACGAAGVPDGPAGQSRLQTLLLHDQEGQDTPVSSGGLGGSPVLCLFVCLLYGAGYQASRRD